MIRYIFYLNLFACPSVQPKNYAVYNDTVIDVYSEEDQVPLQRQFQQTYRNDHNSPFQLLRAFTRHPIHTAESLAHLPGRTCFRSLQVGLDISK